MTILKTIGFSAALVAALAITGGAALAHNGDDKGEERGKIAFMRLPSVTIGANGNALVRGAEVTDVTDGTITARTEWDEGSLTWTVETDSGTDFVDRDNDEGSESDIDDGDVISFTGVLTGGLTVEANTVREWPDGGYVDPVRPLEAKGDNGLHLGWNKKFADFWSKFNFKF